MKIHGRKLITILCVITLMLTQYIAIYAKNDSNPEIKKAQIIVKYRVLSKAEEIKESIKGKLSKSKRLGKTSFEYLEITNQTDEAAILAQLSKNKDIEYVQPDYELKTQEEPTDDKFRNQWGLLNNGQTIGNITGINGVDTNATQAWQITKGKNAVIGILDTGIDINHPDIAGNVYKTQKKSPGTVKMMTGTDTLMM